LSRVLRRFAVTWLFNVAALFVASWALTGVSYGDSWGALFVAALVFSLVNMLIRPVVVLLSLPVLIITLGVALFFVNLLMLYITDWVVGGFEISTFGSGVLATLIVWAVNVVLEATLGRRVRGDER
jgi:putative membrane protein